MSNNKNHLASNPIFDDEYWQANISLTSPSVVLPPMTLEGTINKSLLLVGVMLLGGVVGYFNYSSAIFYISIIVALIVAMVSVVSKEHAAIIAVIYAALNGFVFGDLIGSSIRFLPSVLTMMGPYLFLLISLNFKFIDVTQKGNLWTVAAVGSVLFNYLANIILYINGDRVYFLHQYRAAPFILLALFSAWVIYHQVFAITKLVAAEPKQLPNNMEWFGALGLLVAVVWVFLFPLRAFPWLMEFIVELLS